MEGNLFQKDFWIEDCQHKTIRVTVGDEGIAHNEQGSVADGVLAAANTGCGVLCQSNGRFWAEEEIQILLVRGGLVRHDPMDIKVAIQIGHGFNTRQVTDVRGGILAPNRFGGSASRTPAQNHALYRLAVVLKLVFEG